MSATAEDKVCSKAYLFQSSTDEDSISESDSGVATQALTGLRFNSDVEIQDDSDDTSESEDDGTRNNSPLPDDTNCKYMFN